MQSEALPMMFWRYVVSEFAHARGRQLQVLAVAIDAMQEYAREAVSVLGVGVGAAGEIPGEFRGWIAKRADEAVQLRRIAQGCAGDEPALPLDDLDLEIAALAELESLVEAFDATCGVAAQVAA